MSYKIGFFSKHADTGLTGVDSTLGRLIASCRAVAPSECAEILENSAELEQAYRVASQQGSSAIPDAEEEAECHYVCYIKDPGGNMLLMDGDLDGLVKTNIILSDDEDVLADAALEVINHMIRESAFSERFNLMALVKRG